MDNLIPISRLCGITAIPTGPILLSRRNICYLETRGKEDAFLEKVLTSIREGLQASPATMAAGLVQLLQAAQSITNEPREPDNDSLDAALDFADSF